MNGWKDIKGYEGIYQAHPDGRLRSVDRYRKMTGGNKTTKFEYNRFIPGKVLDGGLDKNGYRIGVFHDKNGTRRTFRFHRLTAETFIPNPHNLPEVNHKDGNKINNSVDNLEWMTTSQNIQHAFDSGLKSMSWKERAVARLDAKTLEVLETYESATVASKEGFSRPHIGGCCRGDYGRKTHKGFVWKYVADLESSTTIPKGSTLQAHGSGSGEHLKR